MMLVSKKKIFQGLGLCLLASYAFAADIQNVGQIQQSIRSEHGATKIITLDKYHFSERAKQLLTTRFAKQRKMMGISSAAENSATLPRALQLGMNDFPVLDQGQHGTCVVFAVTAALDATLNHNHYSSQLCLLRLGQYLERTNWVPSGWDGFKAAILLVDRIKQNGVISLENQERYGCGGVFSYPKKDSVPEGEMSLAHYQKYRELPPITTITWSFLWSSYGYWFENHAVEKTKEALSRGNRVLVGIILLKFNSGVAGATGTHHVPDDTWVLTNQLDEGMNQDAAGHEMILTGYDDDAYAIDRYGHKHQGLFTLRSSWGPEVGDEGNFYISYDYYQWFTAEAIQTGLRNLSA